MNTLIDLISHFKIGTPNTFRNLTLFPVLDGQGKDPDYLTLDEALAFRCAKVTEVSESGSVPELKFINESDKSVFLLDGEELIGAKQNLVLNLSILAPAGKTLIIPVSCVESGRWNQTSKEFRTAPRAQYAEGRAIKMASVTENMKSAGTRQSDQSEVWAGIGLKFGKFGMYSPTSAMSDLYERETVRIEDFVRALPAAVGQSGILFGINGRIMGGELFDCCETLRKLYPKLLRSYALDALDALTSLEEDIQAPDVAQAEAFISRFKEAEMNAFPAIGEGQDVRLTAQDLTGAALVLDERVVYLGLFRLEGASGSRGKG